MQAMAYVSGGEDLDSLRIPLDAQVLAEMEERRSQGEQVDQDSAYCIAESLVSSLRACYPGRDVSLVWED
jgi:hypothetical protein